MDRRLFSCCVKPHGSDTASKKVSFDENVVIFYHTTNWREKDYIHARRGPWMRAAADRHRFQRRIRTLDEIIGPVLTDEHRRYIRDTND